MFLMLQDEHISSTGQMKENHSQAEHLTADSLSRICRKQETTGRNNSGNSTNLDTMQTNNRKVDKVKQTK